MNRFLVLFALIISWPVAGCRQASVETTAFTGLRIIDGTGGPVIESGVLLVRHGRIESVGPADEIRIPRGATEITLPGRTVIPGIINTHGHVGRTVGLRASEDFYTEENVLRQLALYARYGVTTVAGMGDDGPEGIYLRDTQDRADLARARLFVAGPVVVADEPDEARRQVQELAGMNVDFVKIRVDDNLGATTKMPPEVYRAVIDEAHRHGLPVSAHMYYLEDARDLLNSGVDFLAHSIRDQLVDDEFIDLIRERGVALCPTLTREVSVFIYERTPDFFKDPFFYNEVDPDVLRELENPVHQRAIQANPRAQHYKEALEMAKRNMRILHDAGIPIAFGTDSGPPARFQGFFEHLELELMAEAGLNPMDIIVSATSQAARALNLEALGTLAPGNHADFIILTQNPLEDIRHTRTIESVWIAGNRVPGRLSD